MKHLDCVRVLAFTAALLVATTATADMTLLPAPDIFSSFIDVTYDSSADSLSASGFAISINDDDSGPAETITGGSFDLNATINDAGVLSGGTLNIGGTVSDLGFNSGTLLTGNLSSVQTADSGSLFEFMFTVTGGDAAGLFGTGPGGIILGSTGFEGSFASDFNNLLFDIAGTGGGLSDTAALSVPLPGATVLGMVGIGLLGWVRRSVG